MTGVGVADYTVASTSAAPSEIFRTLFVYGPLMADEVLMLLLGRVPKHRPATLNGWVRCCKRGAEQVAGVCSTHRGLVAASYPAAVQTDDHNHNIDGLLLERLRPQELRCLDHCKPSPPPDHPTGANLILTWMQTVRACARADEDPTYQQTQVTVTTNSGFGASEPVTALVYAWGGAASELDVQRPWSYTEFRTHNMATFSESVVKKCRASFEKQEGALEVVMTERSQRSHRGGIPADHPARQ